MNNQNQRHLGILSDQTLLGNLYKVNDPNPNAAAVIGRTSFSNNQPTFAFNSNVMTQKRKLISYFSLEQKTPLAGGDIEILVFIDPTNRLLSGGNKNDQIALKNPFQPADKFPRDFDFSINPTLDAPGPGSGLTLIERATFPAALGSIIEIDCDEDWMISPGGIGTLAIWVISASTGLSFKHHIEVIQF